MLLSTLGASLLGNMLAGKGFVWDDDGIIRAEEEQRTIRAEQNF